MRTVLVLGLLGCGAATAGARAAFRPAWWCRGAHLQTIWGGILRRAPRPPLVHERWELPDGDFLDVDELPSGTDEPRVIVLHGLEGSSRSPQVLGMLDQAHRRGWGGVAVNFRGCSSVPNRLRRSYHGGDTGDLAWVIERVQREHPSSSILCVGFSLGGNVLLKYLGERGDALPEALRAAAAVSTPFDLARSAQALDHGFSRVYGDRLVISLTRKTVQKLSRYPDLVDAGRLARVRTLSEFDELVTAPVHGFANAEEYWAKSSSAQFLARIRRPTLLINAQDDPFLPADALPRAAVQSNPFLTAEFPEAGGHLGFIEGRWPWAARAWAEARAAEFLSNAIRPQEEAMLEQATFAAGCFWGVELLFRQVKGVVNVTVGYTGGTVANPTYEQVCSHTTGHAEAVLVDFDPSQVSYAQLLQVFWNNHNPTTPNRQGPDVGSQYRSAVFFHAPAQQAAAETMKRQLEQSRRFRAPIVTQIMPATTFYPAEEYHQRYFEKRGGGQCHINLEGFSKP